MLGLAGMAGAAGQMLEQLKELGNLAALKALLAAIWTWLADMVGHPGSAFSVLLMLLLFDLVLGFARAWKVGDLRAQKLTGGAFKLFKYWLAVAVFVLAEKAIRMAIPLPFSLRDAFIAYLAINEALSCVEHLAFFGMPVPESFIRRLTKYRETLSRDEDESGQKTGKTDD